PQRAALRRPPPRVACEIRRTPHQRRLLDLRPGLSHLDPRREPVLARHVRVGGGLGPARAAAAAPGPHARRTARAGTEPSRRVKRGIVSDRAARGDSIERRRAIGPSPLSDRGWLIIRSGVADYPMEPTISS